MRQLNCTDSNTSRTLISWLHTVQKVENKRTLAFVSWRSFTSDPKIIEEPLKRNLDCGKLTRHHNISIVIIDVIGGVSFDAFGHVTLQSHHCNNKHFSAEFDCSQYLIHSDAKHLKPKYRYDKHYIWFLKE